MYAPGKILVMGGGDPPTNTAEVIDLNQSSPTWRAVQSMAFARRQLNATLLPDGNVLVTGGTSSPGFNDPAGAVHAAELWNPTTEQWTTLASSSGIPRVYHSTAVLLPDGRVLSMGGNGYLQTEIYSPPYLFKGTRPTITSAPTSVVYGQSFFVETPDAAAISKVTMLRLSSVTHAFNMSQHISTLSFSQAAGGLNVVAPSGAAVASPATVAPPGHYLLFILNGSGVPSVGRIVQVGSDPTALTLTTLSPSSAVVGGPDFTLTVNGNNFVSGSVVRWNGANRPTTFVSATRLTAQIPATDIAAGGTASVTVLNPSPGGAVSNALTFTITTLSREVWTGISGTTVASIPVGTTPNITDTLPNFEAPEGWADNYGTRLRGYIKAPVTGNYIFWIASDDNSELWLSTNDNPVNKMKIASVPDWTDSRQWDKFPSQKSVAIPLQANQSYYVEALQKEGGGGDNLAVGWAKPGQATSAPSEVIPGSVLSPFSGGTVAGPEINVLGNGTTITDGDTTPSGSDHTDFGSTDVTSGTVTRTFTIQNLGTASLTVGSVSLSNAAEFSVIMQPPASPVAAGGNTSFQVRFDPSAVGTRSATVSFSNNDADENPYNFALQGTGGTAGSGSITREVWTAITGNTVANIPVGTTPNLTDTLPSFEAPTNWADNYGTRSARVYHSTGDRQLHILDRER